MNRRVIRAAVLSIPLAVPSAIPTSLISEILQMKRLLLVLSVIALVAGTSAVTSAQVKKGKTRLMTTKQLMAGLVQPHCKGLGDALKTQPTDDKAWADLAVKAALLNESSYTMMDDGRCPDGVWKEACDKLRSGSEALHAKLDAKDFAGAQAAFKDVTASCGICHKAHKK